MPRPALLILLPLAALAAEPAGRRIDIRVDGDFGARPEDVRAVAASAAGTIWAHCPDTEWRTPGFALFPHPAHPIALHEHGPDGRIRIGVTTRGTYWSQLAFQFAHEFGHALAGHSGDWRECQPRQRARGANFWLEETLCETASLFALRAMAREWETRPPYPNWKSYAPSLAGYAEQRLGEARRTLPEGDDLAAWLRRHEPEMRRDPARRELNLAVAARLLPLFERDPRGWEAVTRLNRGPDPGPAARLGPRLAAWREACPPARRAFVAELARTLGERLP